MSYQERITQSRQKVYEKAVATKILDLMGKLTLSNDENPKRRWIWELLQNAKDVKSINRKNVDINVELNYDKRILVFKHNGRCFSTDNITFLIEQVSTKDRSEENPEETTGKFGTGFLTTHLLSKIVEVRGIVKDDELPYRKFCINLDRSGEEISDVINSVNKSIQELNRLDDAENYESYDENDFNTIFSYHLDSDGIDTAEIGIRDLETSLPLTLIFLPSISTVEVQHESSLYSANEPQNLSPTINNLCVSHCIVEKASDSQSHSWSFIVVEAQDFQIALPIDEKNSTICISNNQLQNVPRLFCDFPLVGSEELGTPFYINSSHFHPTEPRDGIFLVDKDNPKIKRNKNIITAAVDCYVQLIDYAISQKWESLYYLAMIKTPSKIDWLSPNWYQKNVLQPIRDKLYIAPLVKTESGDKIPLVNEDENIVFIPFHSQFEIREAIWDLVSDIFWIPAKSDIHNWYEIFKDKIWDKRHHLTISKLSDIITQDIENLEDLSEKFNIRNPIDWLNQYFSLIQRAEKDGIKFLESYKIIPNQHGELCFPSSLKYDPGIEDSLKDVGEIIVKDYRKHFADKSISIANLLTPQLQNSLVEEINQSLKSEKKSLDNQKKACHALNCLFPSQFAPEESSLREKRSLIYDLSKKLFDTETPEKQFLNTWSPKIWEVSDQMQVEFLVQEISSFENLFNLSEHLSESVDDTCNWLSSLIDLIAKSTWQNLLSGEFPILPNQNGNFCDLKNLSFEQDLIEEVLKNISANLTRDFRDKLIDSRFNISTLATRQISQKDVVRKINEVLESEEETLDKKKEACHALSAVFPKEEPQLLATHTQIYELSKKLFNADTPEKQFLSTWSPEICKVSDQMQVEFIVKEISKFENLSELSKHLSETSDDTCHWLSSLANLIVESEWDKLLRGKTPILPNQNGSFFNLDDLFSEKEPIDEELKDIAANLRRDFRDKLMDTRFDPVILGSHQISQRDVGSKIQNLARNLLAHQRESGSQRSQETQHIFDDLIVWMNDNEALAKDIFGDLFDNRHILYDDSEVAENLRRVGELKHKNEELTQENQNLKTKNQKLQEEIEYFKKQGSNPSHNSEKFDESDAQYRVNLQHEPEYTNLLPERPDPESILNKILDWWKKNRISLIQKHEDRLYPVRDHILTKENFENDNHNDAKTAKRWLTLFCLGALQSMGRSKPEQHRDFLKYCEEWGWFDVMVSREIDQVAWMNLLANYFEMPQASNNLEYYQWVRYYPAFYAFSRWWPNYRDSLLSADDQRGQLSFPSLLNPQSNLALQGSGGDVPPAGSLLNIGAIFVVRELMRAGILTNPGMKPYAYVPVRRVRAILFKIGCQEVRVGNNEKAMENSRHIHDFLIQHLGKENATFCDDYDLPFLMLPKEKEEEFLGQSLQEPSDNSDDDVSRWIKSNSEFITLSDGRVIPRSYMS